jgi:hypothetical protein
VVAVVVVVVVVVVAAANFSNSRSLPWHADWA